MLFVKRFSPHSRLEDPESSKFLYFSTESVSSAKKEQLLSQTSVYMNKTAILLTALVFASCVREQKPNIILIMTDDQGWYDAGFNGNRHLMTPNLDRMASEGIILDRFYSASAVCSPTRASVITGRNPLRMNIPNANSGHMKPEEITLPELLKEQGYYTGHFGKWHLGTLTRKQQDSNRGGRAENHEHYSIPTLHGYDTFFCTEAKVPTFDPLIYPDRFDEGESKRYGWKALENSSRSRIYGTAYWKGEEQKDTLNVKGDDSRIIMDRVLPFIERSMKDGKPFFTTIWFHAPHLPVVSDSLHRDIYDQMRLEDQLYYGTITAMDEQLGRLWEKLDLLGIQEETIIWFCSDNGPENGTPGSSGPYRERVFRERKRSLYEGGVRVPAFVIWKGTFKSGIRMDIPAVTSDYLPTILEILQVEYPDSRPLDGESLREILQGGKRERDKPISSMIARKS